MCLLLIGKAFQPLKIQCGYHIGILVSSNGLNVYWLISINRNGRFNRGHSVTGIRHGGQDEAAHGPGHGDDGGDDAGAPLAALLLLARRC